MAEVFRPTYTVTDPTTGKKSKRKSKTWHVRYYTPDGVRHRVKGYRDKKATETFAAQLERRGIRGLLVKRDELCHFMYSLSDGTGKRVDGNIALAYATMPHVSC